MQRWQDYTLAYKRLLDQMEHYFDRCPDGFPNIMNNSSNFSQMSESADDKLASFTRLLLCRNFKVAAEKILELDYLNPLHVIKMICFYELRGAVSEACRVAHCAVECFQAKIQAPEEFIFCDLFKLCEAYFCCFTQGRWTEAIEMVVTILDQFASTPETHLTTGSRRYSLVTDRSLAQYVLELYCYKIFLLVVRDKNDLLQPDFASNFTARLRHLCHTLTKIGAYDLALDALSMELDVQQEEEMIFELEQTEYHHNRRVFVRQLKPAIKSLEDFLSMLPKFDDSESLSGNQTAGLEASARLLLGYSLAENELDDSDSEYMKDNLTRAWELFEFSGSSIGQAEALMLSSRYYINLDIEELPGWDAIEACFRAQGYFKGLVELCEFKATIEVNNNSGDVLSRSLLPTGPLLYQLLLTIVEEAGDKLLFSTFRVRSMRNWIEGPTFIMLCENMFHPNEGFLSDQLFLEASKLLSQLYEINNNFAESSAFALLHLRVAHARHDPVLLDYATMLYFRCVGNMVPTIADGDRIYEVASLAFSFDRIIARLCYSALARMETSAFTMSAGSLPIESLLWSAHLVRHVIEDDGIQSMSPQVILVLYRSLKLAVDLLLALPIEFHGIFFSEVCQALGTAAEMLANPILSLFCYELGQSRLVGSDGYRQAVLQLKIGRRMTSWIYQDRPNFLELQDVAFAYLDQAVDFFWSEGSRQSSYKNGLEASLVLARAHLREFQCLIEELDWGEDTEGKDIERTDEQQANKQRLLDHLEAGLYPVQKAIDGNLTLRRRLKDLPTMQALENSRFFYFHDMEELYWTEMGLEMDKSMIIGDPARLLMAIQKWKAVSLQDTISQRLEYSVRPPDLVSSRGSQPVVPAVLDPGNKPPEFQEQSIWAMAEIAEAHLEEGQSIIFVDWTRYYDTLFIVAYNGTEGRIKNGVVEIDYHMIEEWVRCELGVSSLHQGHTDRKRLHKFTRLKDLTPILEKLEGFAKPKDLLVLCPSGILHAVPLQAIPFGPKGKPLIASNPVAFCPSFSLLQTCINSVKNSTVLSSIPTVAFSRLGPGDDEEEFRMYETARNGLADKMLQTRLTSGAEVTREAFMSRSRGARLLHYHGHAYLEAAQRRDRALQLEPREATAELPSDDGLLTVMNIFDLQLDSAVVVLLACASGEDDVAPNDDPLGILSAFLFAGASSVIATRWPTQTSDARDFAKNFYQKVFSSRKDGIANLAVAVQAAVLELWEDWDEDDPYHWAQFQLRKFK
ncbi:tetratricopeptide repeat protein [Rutstroemia sp. NJR-2017a BBW]|nr:tetratricopeptide repeat protein [Rutstroemia sp. NJR-2017a BBW]